MRVLAEPVSELTTNRLSVYLRCLSALDAAGVRTISSQALAEQFHLNAAQIRKDLANFGEFGVRGIGYYVKELRRHLRQILGLDRGVRVAIIGAGNLGLALADYAGFRDDGFEIVALFDTLKEKIGRRSRGGVLIHAVKDFRKIARREPPAVGRRPRGRRRRVRCAGGRSASPGGGALRPAARRGRPGPGRHGPPRRPPPRPPPARRGGPPCRPALSRARTSRQYSQA